MIYRWLPLIFVVSTVLFLMCLSLLPEKKLYQYKGKTYKIKKQYYKALKHPTTREWVDFVEYKQIESGETYFREAEEFFKLFQEM